MQCPAVIKAYGSKLLLQHEFNLPLTPTETSSDTPKCLQVEINSSLWQKRSNLRQKPCCCYPASFHSPSLSCCTQAWMKTKSCEIKVRQKKDFLTAGILCAYFIFGFIMSQTFASNGLADKAQLRARTVLKPGEGVHVVPQRLCCRPQVEQWVFAQRGHWQSAKL